MPLLWAIAALVGAGAFLIDRSNQLGKDSGLFSSGAQTNIPEAKGTLGQNVDKVGSAASTGLLLVSAAFAYSLVKR
jgi:hypothetical protein